MAAVQFESGAANNCRVVALDSTHFVVAWTKGTTAGFSAIVGVLSGGVISFGTALATVNSTKTYAELALVALDSTHAVVVARQSSDNPDTLFGYVLTVSGLGVTIGPASASAASIGNPNPFTCAMCRLDSTRVLLAYGESTSTSTFFNGACVGTVSGTDVTWGASVQWDGAVKIPAPLDVCAVSSTKAVVCYRDADNNGYGRVLTVSGTDVTAGAATLFESSSIIPAFISVVALDASRMAVAYHGETSGRGNMRVGTVSGSAVSFGAANQFLANANLTMSKLAKLGTDALSLVYADNGPAPDEYYFKEAFVSGDTISYGASLGTWITGTLLNANAGTCALAAVDVIVACKSPADNKGYADLLSYPAVTTTTAPPVAWDEFPADGVSLADSESASAASPQSDGVTLSDGISTASGVEHLDSESDGVTLSDGISTLSGGPHDDSEADGVSLADAATPSVGKALADSVLPLDTPSRLPGKALADSASMSDFCRPGGGPVAEKAAASGLSVEWACGRRRAGASGLTAEWVQSKRKIAALGLMVDFYPYFFNALWGDRFAFTSTCAQDIDAAGLGPNKIVCCWTEPGDPLESVRVRAGLRSDPFVDFPVPGRVAARPGHVPRMSAIGPSKFAVAYSAGAAPSVVVGRVDLQSDVEVGEPLALLSTACSVLDVCDVGKDRFLVVFHRENDSDRAWSVVCSVPGLEGGSGLIPTAGSPAIVTTRRVDRIRCAAIDSTHAAVIYRDADGGEGWTRACAVSGFAPSWGGEQKFSDAWAGAGDVASMNDVSWEGS